MQLKTDEELSEAEECKFMLPIRMSTITLPQPTYKVADVCVEQKHN